MEDTAAFGETGTAHHSSSPKIAIMTTPGLPLGSAGVDTRTGIASRGSSHEEE